MTVAHEFGHALDCALGGGVYRSGIDPELRRLYVEARTFVTPYAATGIDEYFVSVTASDAISHDAITKVPGSFQKMLKGLENLDSIDGVTICTNPSPSLAIAERSGALSSNGKSGTISPHTPPRAAAAASFAKPKASSGLK